MKTVVSKKPQIIKKIMNACNHVEYIKMSIWSDNSSNKLCGSFWEIAAMVDKLKRLFFVCFYEKKS